MGPIDNGDGTYAWMWGVHSEERFEMRIAYTLTTSTGALEVVADRQNLPLADGAARAVEAACKN